jgi:FKBP-type peptidyl-prolyl cis-trans isomerase (trigger factor)
MKFASGVSVGKQRCDTGIEKPVALHSRHFHWQKKEKAMPQKDKVTIQFEVERDHAEWLEKAAADFELKSDSKALRVLLDFAIKDVDEDLIFSQENMHCRHC